MIKIDESTRKQLLEYYRDNEICLEGHILKVIAFTGDEEFDAYLKDALARDAESRRKRIDFNKDVQHQNIELRKAQAENEEIKKRLRTSLDTAETAKNLALDDLETAQKKTQVELISSIVKVALWIICGVGVITSCMFVSSLWLGIDNKVIETAWSNMFGILLTNSFSIVGTIMGVKYASEKSSKKKCKCNCEED
jgi:hypothetical protein